MIPIPPIKNHTKLSNVGTKTHAQIDTAIDTTLPGLVTTHAALTTGTHGINPLNGDIESTSGSQGKVDTHNAITGTGVHGLGTMSTQASDGVNITGGTVNGVTLQVDTIAEKTAAAGVTIDSCLVKDGQITTNTSGRSYFKSTDDVDLDAVSGAAIFGSDGTGQHITIGTNEVQSKSNGTTAAGLLLNNEGGAININGAFTPRYNSIGIGIGNATLDDGGAYTSYTTAANNSTANDVQLLPAIPVVNDAFYIGQACPFGKLTLNIGTAGVGTWTITQEYYNGSAWTALSGVTDNTTGFTVSGSNTVTWTMPTDWIRNTVNNNSLYWVRFRVSAYTSVTTQPLGTQIFCDEYYPDTRMNTIGANAGTITMYLPDPTTSGRIMTITKISATAGTITIDSVVGNINGAATTTLTNQYDSKTFVSCGSTTGWIIIAAMP